MICTVEGLPKPTQFWKRRDGKKLDTENRVTQLASGALFIRSINSFFSLHFILIYAVTFYLTNSST